MTPTRARFTVLRFTLALAVVTYLDRVAISSAAPAIRNELGLSLIQMGWVFSVFTFAYAAFEIPSGWLGDITGPRKVLTRIVLWWSAFTMMTGAAWNFASLLVVRFLFGVGEAGAFPNISRSFANWFPIAERGNAHGVIFMGTRLGGAIAPPLIVLLMAAIGWRLAFVVFGAIGVVWCVFWQRWFQDDPASHPSVNAAELETIRRGLPARGPLPPFEWRHLLSRQRRAALPDVLHDAVHAVLQPDVAADLPERGARLHRAAGRLHRRHRAVRRSDGQLGGRKADGLLSLAVTGCGSGDRSAP